ncbi:hypothetical protein L914_06980 [Phytophthora nicotianae]|uniref:Uncharacterized protein n=2 Tax=Phytophthora nicotianae TaxID=4792 RepID=W2NKL3_PHYNI|nr:hypothetical protein L914_06980 [Phytophthora nicotianae]ETO77570.1 hypothetical protein F444_07245 [Phytophthora nicotianae P1976]
MPANKPEARRALRGSQLGLDDLQGRNHGMDGPWLRPTVCAA